MARKFPKLFRATSLSTSWKLRRQCASVVYTPLRLRLHVGMLALGPNPAALADLDNPKTGSPCLLEAPKCSFTGSQKEFEMPSVRPTSLEQDQGPRKIKFPREALPSKSPKDIQKTSQNGCKRRLEGAKKSSKCHR